MKVGDISFITFFTNMLHLISPFPFSQSSLELFSSIQMYHEKVNIILTELNIL